MKLVITDLTRFRNQGIVCTAGVNPDSGQCVRPMPYFSYDECKKRNVHPGMVLDAPFSTVTCAPPHTEDMECAFGKVKFLGPATSEEFEGVLKKTVVSSIQAGFGGLIPLGQKVIPAQTPPKASIITVLLKPNQIQVINDAYNEEKIKLHIYDTDGINYSFVAITDLGFHHYAQGQRKDPSKDSRLNAFIAKQKRVYLRIGLSRLYAVGSRNGYWLQANGIYTFPDYLSTVRKYP